jgi:hypothetical protein
MSLFQELFHIKMNHIQCFLFLAFSSLAIIPACGDKNDTPEPARKHGKIVFSFVHLENGNPLVFDSLKYTNEAGNPYLVSEIQYFISDVTLFRDDGYQKHISDWLDIYYVDTDLPETMKWEVYDKIEPGRYDSIGFRFGISEEKNLSFMFVNPPERDMFWPEFLGGGYHYLKLNGKWLASGQTFQTWPFDFHLGIGQEYYSYPDSITGFIHNDFWVSLPGSDFEISAGETVHFEISMHVENWFRNPHVYDHDVYGGDIMQNQEAMQKGKENGWNVFSIGLKEDG